MGGLIDGGRALILIKHESVDRTEAWCISEGRWPETVLRDPGKIEPSSTITAAAAAALARRRLSVQPIEVVILPQAAVADYPWDSPMPMIVFSFQNGSGIFLPEQALSAR